MNTWAIFKENIAPGEKKQLMLTPNVKGYEMPVTLINGAEDGKTILITACVHGDEYPGMAAAVHLAKEIDPRALRGRLIIIPCVNTQAFWNRSRFFPEDHTDLNASFPGCPDGSVGERLPNFFIKEIFPHLDFLIDLHSGSVMEPLTPCLFYSSGSSTEVTRVSLEAAKATDIPLLIASTAKNGMYSYPASLMGIPGLLLERGHSGHCRQDWVKDYLRDLRRLLIYFDMLEGKEKPVPAGNKTVCHKAIYLTSKHKGLWYPAIEEGQRVQKGDLLGHVEDFRGEHMADYCAEDDGMIFYYTSGLAINLGNPLVAYGLSAEMESAVNTQ